MDNAKNRLSESPNPRSGLRRDLDRLRTDGHASLGELREFLGRMHGKSPQEALGVFAESRLAVSILISAAATVVLLFVLTIVPWLMKGSGEQAAAADARPKNAPAASATETKAEPSGEPAPAVAGNGSAPKPGSPEDDLLKKLGINETKTGTPKIDSLDNILDKPLAGSGLDRQWSTSRELSSESPPRTLRCGWSAPRTGNGPLCFRTRSAGSCLQHRSRWGRPGWCGRSRRSDAAR